MYCGSKLELNIDKRIFLYTGVLNAGLKKPNNKKQNSSQEPWVIKFQRTILLSFIQTDLTQVVNTVGVCTVDLK